MVAAHAAELAKMEAMKDDKNAFSATIGAKSAALGRGGDCGGGQHEGHQIEISPCRPAGRSC